MSLPSNSKRKIFDGRYEILSLVGRGVDSVVYHARHITGAAQEVAIKVLVNRDGSSTLTDKLRREALTLVSCRHRYVVRLDDFHSIQDLCYLSMEYAALGDLSKYIATLPNKRLPPEQISLFLKQSLEAIDFVHATGVIHRDIKPENILVLGEKEIRLADFGLALLPGDEVQLEELQKAVGSFEYLAPEVLDGVRYDTLSDLYSLGVCFYEAATGSHPFAHAPIAEKLDARRDGRIVPIHERASDLPAHVAAVITTLMRFSSEDRFHSASEALRALENAGFRANPMATADAGNAPASAPANDDQMVSHLAPDPAPVSASPVVAQAVEAPSPIQETPKATEGRPANADAVGSRPNPTEKIDLERIKAIIARDTQRRSGSSAGTEGSLERAATADLLPGTATARATDPSKSTTHHAPVALESQATRGKRRTSGIDRPRTSLLASALIRFAGVALAFALLTVTGIYGYNLLFRRSASVNASSAGVKLVTPPETNEQVENDTETAGEDDSQELVSLAQLPEGVHPGSIQGLFRDSDLPMALIANPKQSTLTLLIGLEGWVPATVSTATEDNADSDGPTFRSNGLILKFNQESSSAGITGTVIDVVTGEAGTWTLSR